ncbi:MAG: hypothetical protein AAGI38_03645 [Bacteroidota bacterium]
MRSPLKNTLSLLLIAFLFLPMSGIAQLNVKWEQSLPGGIQWQTITSLGNLIIASGSSLQRIDSETGEVKWSKKQFGNLSESQVEELPGSPFLKIKSGNAFMLMDEFSGDIVFDPAKAGISEVKGYYMFYNMGAILIDGMAISGEQSISLINMADASVKWSIKEDVGRIIAANELGNDEILLTDLFGMSKVKASSGEFIWKGGSGGDKKKDEDGGKFGKLMQEFAKEMVEEAVKDEDFNAAFFHRPGDGICFFAGENKDSRTESVPGEGMKEIPYTYYSFAAFNVQDGSQLWGDLDIEGQLGQVTYRENGLMIVPTLPNMPLNVYNYQTGQGMWGRGFYPKGVVADFLDTESGLLIASEQSNKSYLQLIDPKTGSKVYKRPTKVNGTIAGIVPLSNAVLYLTSSEINILDITKGELKWDKGINSTPSLTGKKGDMIYAFDTRERVVKTIDLTSESFKNLTAEKLTFQGKESPNKLEVMEDGVLLYSDQNIAKYSFDGTLLFNEFYEAPRESRFMQALLLADAAYASYVAAQSYYVAAHMGNAEAELRGQSAGGSQLAGQFKDVYADLGEQASSYAKEAANAAFKRQKATQSGKDFNFILTRQDKIVKLLQVSKKTGKAEGAIDLGRDKNPSYTIDNFSGTVYLKKGDNGLVSYQVGQP